MGEAVSSPEKNNVLGIEAFLFVVLCRIVLGVIHKKTQMLDRFVLVLRAFFASSKVGVFCWPTLQGENVMSKRNPHIFSNGQGKRCCFLCISNLYLGIWGCLVSISEITWAALTPAVFRCLVKEQHTQVWRPHRKFGEISGDLWLIRGTYDSRYQL